MRQNMILKKAELRFYFLLFFPGPADLFYPPVASFSSSGTFHCNASLAWICFRNAGRIGPCAHSNLQSGFAG